MRGAIPPLPQYIFMAWYFLKHMDNFTFTIVKCMDSVCHYQSYVRTFVQSGYWCYVQVNVSDRIWTHLGLYSIMIVTFG
jgi:hypothetical protein